MLEAIAFFIVDAWVRFDKNEPSSPVEIKSWTFHPGDKLPPDFSIREVFRD